jgi:hypothetical protein
VHAGCASRPHAQASPASRADASLDGLHSYRATEFEGLFGLDQRIVLALLLNLQRIDTAKRDGPLWSRASDRFSECGRTRMTIK